MKLNQTFQERVDFFMEHAGTSYHPDHQSPYAGTLCNAMDLATAERWVYTQTSYRFNWEPDYSATGCDYWVCMLVTEIGHGEILEARGGIDLGDDTPYGDWLHRDPYQRVMEAQLALEYMLRRAELSIPLDVFGTLNEVMRRALFNDVMESGDSRIERFMDLDVLRALVMWNDPNGDYDNTTRADYCAIIASWRAQS